MSDKKSGSDTGHNFLKGFRAGLKDAKAKSEEKKAEKEKRHEEYKDKSAVDTF